MDISIGILSNWFWGITRSNLQGQYVLKEQEKFRKESRGQRGSSVVNGFDDSEIADSCVTWAVNFYAMHANLEKRIARLEERI